MAEYTLPETRDPLKAAYFAGLFDGEGTAAIYSRTLPSGSIQLVPEVSLAMTHEFVIMEWRAYFGVGGVHKRDDGNPKHLPRFAWKTTTRKAWTVAVALAPYAIVKRNALEQIIKHYDGAKPAPQLTRSDAYYAGLVDGEGHVGLSRQSTANAKIRPPNVPRIIVEMTEEAPIHELHATFGGFVHGSNRGQRNDPDRKYTWSWTVTFDSARATASRLYPHSIVKSDLLKKIIDLPKYHRGPAGPLTELQVHQIRSRYEAGETLRSIARDFPVHEATVGNVARRQSYKHIK